MFGMEGSCFGHTSAANGGGYGLKKWSLHLGAMGSLQSSLPSPAVIPPHTPQIDLWQQWTVCTTYLSIQRPEHTSPFLVVVHCHKAPTRRLPWTLSAQGMTSSTLCANTVWIRFILPPTRPPRASIARYMDRILHGPTTDTFRGHLRT